MVAEPGAREILPNLLDHLRADSAGRGRCAWKCPGYCGCFTSTSTAISYRVADSLARSCGLIGKSGEDLNRMKFQLLHLIVNFDLSNLNFSLFHN